MKKRTLAIAMSMAMTAGLLAGCGSSSSGTAAPATTAAPAAQETAASQAEEKTEAPTCLLYTSPSPRD